MEELDSDGAGGRDDDGNRSGAGGDTSTAGSTNGLGAAMGLGGAGAGGVPDSGGGSAGLGGAVSAAGAGGTPEAVDAGPSGPLPPSCIATNPQCGDVTNRASCCESLPVAAGSFLVQADFAAPDSTQPVTISAFRLDRFEVSVGRMREFIAHYDEWRSLGQPEQDLGAHPLIPGSGWQLPRFSDQLPASAAEFETRLRECILGLPSTSSSASTYAEGLSDEVPLNCASWFEAAAFCAWDGGRLPTLRELAYAAAGGALQRVYPWGDEPVPSRALALFGCIIDSDSPVCTVADIAPVGASPLGAGFFGQDDLAGSMSEWVLDVDAPITACTDCAALGPDEALRRWRASSWVDRAELMNNGLFLALPPDLRTNYLGLRCARDD